MKHLDEWRRWQQAQGLSQRTITERAATMRHLEHEAGVDLLHIEPEHIIAYCSRPGLAPSSRASYHATIRAFYAWAVRVGKLSTDPTERTPRPKRPKTLPRPVQQTHVSALLRVVTRRRTRMMVVLAAYAGLRVHEIAKFRGEDLDRLGGTMTVTGKGGKTALIPAHEVVLEEAANFPICGPWFPAYDGSEHIGAHAVSTAIRRAMRRAGFAGKPHQLRHYYATELLEHGVDVRVVRDLMRHESIATTEIYTQVSLQRMIDGIAALPRAA